MNKERAIIEETLSERDLEAMRANRTDYSPALFEAVRNYRETLESQMGLLRVILKEVDSE